ncbi:RNA methyltransferase [Prevotella intermedia]|uniref:RNA methyltransferase n=1 Tax=Prevotella intermedia TaxID=28131 RepID=UPI0005EB7E0F|nr:RNA methyltransferase [Prevotella intermedia]
MISKNKIKLVRALETKKGREKQGLFVAEGPKVVGDLLAAGFELVELFEEEEDIKKVSFLQHPQGKLGIFKLPEQTKTKVGECETAVGAERKVLLSENELALALDGVQDPGNLGTIIRVADWFSIERIFCSMDTADCWNPKVVQATMGSIARVKMYYLNLNELINSLPTDYPIYGTLLDGEDIYEEKLSANGLIVMGNEGNGISAAIRQRVNRKLLIPNFSVGTTRAESLNVAIATAVVCSEFKRREQRKV